MTRIHIDGLEVTFEVVEDYAKDWGLLRATGLDHLGDVSNETLCLLSIAKWETIAQAYEDGAIRVRDGGQDTCAFCKRHRRPLSTCDSCPIALCVGFAYCRMTPYASYNHALATRRDPTALEFEARAEVAFLNEVLDYIRKENNDG